MMEPRPASYSGAEPVRTKHGLEAIRAMSAVPGAIVGVGTLTRPEEFVQARDAGAVFGVSPGLTSALVAAAKSSGFRLRACS